jgi:hypothetical protein
LVRLWQKWGTEWRRYTRQTGDWRVFRNNATFLAEAVNARLATEKVDYLIFALLDNSIYHAMAENGDMLPPCRGIDGTYHMHGDLVVGSKLAQHSLFKSIKPLLDCAKGKGAALLSPLPRYLVHGCCRDVDHMPNRAAADFAQQLKAELRGVSANLKDFLYTAGYRNIKVLDPNAIFRGREDDQIWGDDPIHPVEAAYDLLAAAGKELCVAAGNHSCKKRPRADSDAGRRSVQHRRPSTDDERSNDGGEGSGYGGGGNRDGVGGSGGHGGGTVGRRGRGGEDWRWSRGLHRNRGGGGGGRGGRGGQFYN